MVKVDLKGPEVRKALHDENGHEVPDQRPVAVPAGFKRPETLAEQVQRLVRGSLSRQAAERGFETFEESEDFDVGDEVDPASRYETFFDPILGRDLSLDEFKRNEAVYRQQYLDREVKRGIREDQAANQAEAIEAAKASRRARRARKSGDDNSRVEGKVVEPGGDNSRDKQD